jgi:hypothetical protein
MIRVKIAFFVSLGFLFPFLPLLFRKFFFFCSKKLNIIWILLIPYGVFFFFFFFFSHRSCPSRKVCEKCDRGLDWTNEKENRGADLKGRQEEGGFDKKRVECVVCVCVRVFRGAEKKAMRGSGLSTFICQINWRGAW